MPNFAYDLPSNYYFGGGHGTFIAPLALGALFCAIILIVVLPRRLVVFPLILGCLLIPSWNTLVIAGLNFHTDRILLLTAWIRLFIRKDRYEYTMNAIDKAVLIYALANAICYTLVWRQAGAAINRLGFLFSALGLYFLLRSLIRDKEDILRVIKVLAIGVIVLAPFLWYEHTSKFNAFSLLGAPHLASIRNGRIRAQGPFSTAINAGAFGVVLIPLFVGMWWYSRRDRRLAALAIISSTVMMFASQSATPVLTFPAAIFALMMWPARTNMRRVRRLLVVAMVGVQLTMHNPIWHVLVRLGGMLGGSGWHREMLMDNFARHFFQWCLIGTNKNPQWGWSMWDVDNAYVSAGIMGGLIGFISFIAIFVYGYKMIGVTRTLTENTGSDERMTWAIGASLFANSIAFFGIVYFDQSRIAWYVLLVLISVMYKCVREQRGAPAVEGISVSRASLRFAHLPGFQHALKVTNGWTHAKKSE